MTPLHRARLLLASAVTIHVTVLYAPTAGVPGERIPFLDKLVHAAVFAAVAAAGPRAGLSRGALAVALIAHAGVSELVQHHLLPGRTGDPWDSVADLAGTLVGLAAVGSPGRRTAGGGRSAVAGRESRGA